MAGLQVSVSNGNNLRCPLLGLPSRDELVHLDLLQPVQRAGHLAGERIRQRTALLLFLAWPADASDEIGDLSEQRPGQCADAGKHAVEHAAQRRAERARDLRLERIRAEEALCQRTAKRSAHALDR